MKHKIPAFTLLLFVVLCIGLQWAYEFHFYFIEQNQMFLFTSYYFTEMVAQPGGLAKYAGEFLVQFFFLPYVGALVTALLLAAVTLFTALICKRIAPSVPLYALYALPAIALLCMHFNFNYFYQGTIAFLLTLVAFYLYLRVTHFKFRLLISLFSVILLYWWAGPVCLLYAFCVALRELLNHTSRTYLSLIPLILAILLSYASYHFAIVGKLRLVFLPDLYYHEGLEPTKEIYYAWISLPLILVIAWFFRQAKELTLKKEIAFSLSQLLVIALIAWAGIAEYNDMKSARLKRFDYYARTGQWDAIIERSQGSINNYLYLSFLNLALAEKGVLATDAFKYDQRDINGLFIPWNRTLQPSILLSDIHFAIGNTAISQEMAFESYVSTAGYGNPRLLKRLIQTNLIYGHYPVAEKYIDILSHTLFYKDWANDHRRFLYNDKAVEEDPLLSQKRECLVADNFLSNPTAVGTDLLAIIRHNANARTALEYMGIACLLMKDMASFKQLIEEFYGTETLPVLPDSFQEAIIILNEGDPSVWEQYRIPAERIRFFQEYKKQVLAHRNNSGAANLLRRSFGHTYWFYYMFK